MSHGPARIRARKDTGQAILDFGPLLTVFDCEEALRLCVRAIGGGKDPDGSIMRAGIMIRGILWSHFQRKGLELKGLNMRDPEGEQVVFTSVDYRKPYQEAEAKLKALQEEVEALRSLQGRDRPRPPRPTMN